ncbi:hypothetical protein BDR26DRAFT_959203 [Obelidium mucronatum]|nr:hypothetical protein BDR26DRAFT_959203 [Obelidium mucronatum]
MAFKQSQNADAWFKKGSPGKGETKNYLAQLQKDDPLGRIGRIKTVLLVTECGSTVLCFCNHISRIGASKTFKGSNALCRFQMERDPKSALFIENLAWAIALLRVWHDVDELHHSGKSGGFGDGGDGDDSDGGSDGCMEASKLCAGGGHAKGPLGGDATSGRGGTSRGWGRGSGRRGTSKLVRSEMTVDSPSKLCLKLMTINICPKGLVLSALFAYLLFLLSTILA